MKETTIEDWANHIITSIVHFTLVIKESKAGVNRATRNHRDLCVRVEVSSAQQIQKVDYWVTPFSGQFSSTLQARSFNAAEPSH
eukprot:1149435-Pelagomonas_calceolata.AAC.4